MTPDNVPTDQEASSSSAAAAAQVNAQISQDVGVVGPGGTVIGFYQVIQYPPAAEPEPGDCPYKGLETYDVQDAPLFFGRELLTAELVRALRDYPFLAVIGASGSGKSSVVRAGVVAALQSGKELEGGVLPPLGSDTWPWRIFTPTATPLEALARAVAPDRGAASQLMEDMLSDTAALRRTLTAQLDHPTQRFLLVVDQFEELFIHSREDKAQHRERQAIIDNLLAAAGVPIGDRSPGGESAPEPAPAVVILTLRADFYDACAAYNHLPATLASHQHYVTAMTQDELLRTVVLPAQAGDWVFQQGLVEQILEDAGAEPGRLPLLSHALYQTWNNRSGRAMTLVGYRKAGRVRGAIAATAEAVYKDRLVRDGTKDERELARRIFLALVEPVEEGRATRRRTSRMAFDPLGDGLTPEMAVLRKLSDPRIRLVTMDQKWVQLAHEALIQEWSRLGDWLQQYRGELELWDGIRDAAAAWSEGKDEKKRTELLVHKGGRLDDAVKLKDGAEYPLTKQERDYVAACLEQRDRELEAERQRQAERVRTAEQLAARQRQARQRLVAAAIIATVALAAIVLAILFFQERNIAKNAQRTAEAESTQASANEAAALAAGTREAQARAEADAAKATVEAQERSIRSDRLAAEAAILLDQTPQASLLLAVEAVNLTRERDEPVSDYVSRTLHSLVETIGGVPLQVATHTPFMAVAFPPDTQMLASVGDDGNVYLWDLENLTAEPDVLRGDTGQVAAVAFSPDGGWLATAGVDGTARLWDMRNRSAEPVVLRGHQERVNALVFSSDGRRLVTASADGTARVWDVQDKSQVNMIEHSGPVRDLDFVGGTDYWLAAVSGENEVAFWHAERDTEKPRWRESFTQTVNSIAFDHWGNALAIGQGDPGSTRDEINLSVYHMQPGYAWPLKGHEGRVTSVSFMPGERWLASASDDATVRLWDLSAWGGGDWEGDPVELRSDGATISQLVFAPDGWFLAGRGGEDDKVRLWDLNDPTRAPEYLRGHDKALRDIAFSADGRWLASASLDGTVRLWDMKSVFSPRVTDDTDLDDLLVQACQATGRNLTQQEWQQYLSDSPYRPTCKQWTAGE